MTVAVLTDGGSTQHAAAAELHSMHW